MIAIVDVLMVLVAATSAQTAPMDQPLELDGATARWTTFAPAEDVRVGDAGGATTTRQAAEVSSAFFLWPEPAPLSGALATDRPGFSDTAFLVPRGHAHLELGAGYAYDHEDQSRARTYTIGTTALRVGVLDDFELRVKWGGMSLVDTRYPDTSAGGRSFIHHQNIDGATDLSVGFKSPILKHTDANHLPNLSMVPSLSIPSGTNTKTSGDVDPTFELAWNYPLSDKLTGYGIGAIASISDADGRFAQASASLAASYALTDRLSLFVEYFGIYPSARNADCQHNLNGGPVLLINDNLQLDFAVGMGLNEEAPDFFTNVGLSIRF